MSREYYDSKGIGHYSSSSRDRANEKYLREEQDAREIQSAQFKLLQQQVNAQNTNSECLGFGKITKTIKIQVKSSGQFLNILNASPENGASACQGNNPTTDNFLWEIIPSQIGGYFLLKVKSSGQFLNILNASPENGASACQCNNPTTDNFLWKY